MLKSSLTPLSSPSIHAKWQPINYVMKTKPINDTGCTRPARCYIALLKCIKTGMNINGRFRCFQFSSCKEEANIDTDTLLMCRYDLCKARQLDNLRNSALYGLIFLPGRIWNHVVSAVYILL